ncbi:glycoside hydrolase family 16 protein [Pseudomassariella vexata]|uniref:Glycoside hydrolase family 16 protein n=1 Tax=Pseudomassariella vexata TaxID=1141098 RepID=A0A1Y2DVZ4_9PEZI|nr:glycoside hydrolase family 16 protein [Pseudomassariella vexata]ORY63284.1 glycoside hydrolase family 16 protein [Pseudomassariella vexata]
MFRQYLLPLGFVLLSASTVLADTQATCSLTNKCPEETPCCSQYGQCGVGAYCLGGCDPRMSFSLDSCVPEPVCVSKTYKMDSTDGIVDVTKYLGDPTKADWVAQGTPLPFDGKVLLTMPPKTAGTVLASTIYMWYGNVKAKIKTGRGAGVVTAFILLSDVKDEIDFEWVGTELEVAQTNYYFQGIPDYSGRAQSANALGRNHTHSGNITGVSDTFANEHEYEIRWTPEKIEWYVDGKLGRTQEKSKTWNASSNQWDFPQTPARVQLSIWPGGADTNAEGTVSWAGGPIDWNSEDIKKYGYDFATVGELTIECYKTSSAPGTNSGKSYTFNNAKATNDTVINGEKSTVLKSFLGTGLDMDKELPKSSSSSGTAQVVPGLTGGGPGANGEAAGDANDGSGSGSGSGATAVGTAPSCTATGFSQACDGGSSNTNEGTRQLSQDHALGASAFAALVAVAGMLWL